MCLNKFDAFEQQIRLNFIGSNDFEWYRKLSTQSRASQRQTKKHEGGPVDKSFKIIKTWKILEQSEDHRMSNNSKTTETLLYEYISTHVEL